LNWRLLVQDEPRSGSWNMALDHALAESNVDGEGVLRFYAWSPHTISFGRNEPARGRYDLATARKAGLGFVRRPTGGRAVLHAREVTYSVVFPVRALGGLRRSYLRISEGLVTGLRSLGCAAEVVTGGLTLPPDAGPCFQAPAPGEVVLAGRKLVGSAQVRMGGSVLQHGSVILSGDQSILTRLTGGAGDSAPPATLDSVSGSLGWQQVTGALAEGLTLALGGSWRQGDVTPLEEDRAARLDHDHYATDAWTWRR
jgi:lipoate-protein ligase A